MQTQAVESSNLPSVLMRLCKHGIKSSITYSYYYTIMSFYHIRSGEGAKYEAVIHCCVLV